MRNFIVNGKQYCEVTEWAAVDVTIPALRAELKALKEAVRFLEGCSYDTIFSLCDDIMTGGVANDEEKAHAQTLLNVLEEK